MYPPRFILTIEAAPTRDAAPPIIRLRRLLKLMLRGYQFRCVEIRDGDTLRTIANEDGARPDDPQSDEPAGAD